MEMFGKWSYFYSVVSHNQIHLFSGHIPSASLGVLPEFSLVRCQISEFLAFGVTKLKRYFEKYLLFLPFCVFTDRSFQFLRINHT